MPDTRHGPPGANRPGFGVDKSAFEKAIGQTVTLEVYRARDGTLYGYLVRLILPGGKSMTVYE